MRVNRNFFIVKISKELQKQKRHQITVSGTGYLGIRYYKDEEKTAFGFKVMLIDTGSPADLAGFHFGDVITGINDKRVKTYDEMIAEVTKHSPLDTIEISYISSFAVNGSISKKSVVLGNLPLSLELPPDIQDMAYNLQFGEIVAKGSNAGKVFPEAIIGSTLLFSHKVEYKERTEGDKNWNDWHLIEADDEFEYRLVHCKEEVLGVWFPEESDFTKSIIPYPSYVFCHSSFQKASMQMVNGIWLPDAWETSKEEIQNKLDELTNQIHGLNETTVMKQKDSNKNYRDKDHIRQAIDSINKERRELSKKMNQSKLVECTVMFVNPKTNDIYQSDINRGDKLLVDYATLYPLDIYGAHYVLARENYIEGLIKA